MNREVKEKFAQAIWVGKSLFERGKTAGSSANLSFRHGDDIYITGSGTCFGALEECSFSKVSLEGEHLEGIMPSKEFPLHQMCYQKTADVQAVVHTHSFYATLYSCVPHTYEDSVIPDYTPYLRMKVGTVGLVPFAKPGSKELFSLFRERVNDSDAYLLANHGPVVPGKSIMDAFYGIEELEESCHIAWELESR